MFFDDISIQNLIVPRYELSNASEAVCATHDGCRIEFAVHIGEAFYTITKKMLSHWGWSLEQLEEIAARNVILRA